MVFVPHLLFCKQKHSLVDFVVLYFHVYLKDNMRVSFSSESLGGRGGANAHPQCFVKSSDQKKGRKIQQLSYLLSPSHRNL